MQRQTLNTGGGGGQEGPPKKNELKDDKPRGLQSKAEHQECSPVAMDLDRALANDVWTWSNKLHVIYHPRGCTICKEYGHHIMEAEFEMDDVYVAVARLRQHKAKFYKYKYNKTYDELLEADKHIHELMSRIQELEYQLEDLCEYEERHGGKWPHRRNTSKQGSPVASTPVAGTLWSAQQTLLTQDRCRHPLVCTSKRTFRWRTVSWGDSHLYPFLDSLGPLCQGQ
jgi:hypothetical protein